MKLTDRQQQVLDLLISFRQEHGFPPTVQELAEMLGCRSPNAAAEHIRALEKKGVITRLRGTSRGIYVNAPDPEHDAAELLRALVAGEENARERAIAYLHDRGIVA
ncbi:Rrf2 family transcriptional regulator [Salmonella enterica]|nr:HTH domain-containing protein [Salmonella enterica]EEG1121512.1 HTH domain-containing protein [Salmonella enterica subsp. diarizonae]EGU4505155.1 HTH domain-containing protein [Salmonella enterica]EKL3601488.1 Rrf2 family transcriptional regulator [Salmonella enterica]EKM3980046.1 Rrf2 family transcriptional regulator [Salmonella enterica]